MMHNILMPQSTWRMRGRSSFMLATSPTRRRRGGAEPIKEVGRDTPIRTKAG